jgi:type I restriction enzyme R subunit
MSSEGPRESDTRREKVLPRLEAAGWVGESVREEVVISPGRIQLSSAGHSRGRLLRADYVLIVGDDHPVGVVEAKREYKSEHDALQQAIRYSERLDAPLAFGTNGDAIVERDLVTGAERELADFPDPSHAWDKAKQFRGVDDPLVDEWLRASFNRRITISTSGVVKVLRYYQRVAVHRTLTAIGRGNRRILLLMATGSGKTFTAMQLIHTLYESSWNPGRRPRILYLADRNILVDQPIAREFRPAFGDGPLHKITKGEAATSREIYFALYQSLMSGEDEGAAVYTAYPPDFFDLIIVDECHRGSSSADSQWRRILEYFDSAIQVGMTATPVKHDNTDTFEYFGSPIYEY